MKKSDRRANIPGIVVLFGSGETSPSGRKVFDYVLHKLPAHPKLALLETPAGFELNSAQVIGRVRDFIRVRLQNYNPQITLVPARHKNGPFSTEDPQILAPLVEADMIFMGPGSPTYAIRQLRDSLAWKILVARHRSGAPIVLASAAAIAISVYALPVYEIYKVGEELHWNPGLDLFGGFGFPLVIIPHWNNNDGGAELDTSRCFMGQVRFAKLMELLPSDLTVLGIDEKTALIIDLQAGVCQVLGLGGVTFLHTGHDHSTQAAHAGSKLEEIARLRDSHIHIYQAGDSFPIQEHIPIKLSETEAELSSEIWQKASTGMKQAKTIEEIGKAHPSEPPVGVLKLMEQRQAAREKKDWHAADVLRHEITQLGWQVVDTPQGQKVEPISQ